MVDETIYKLNIQAGNSQDVLDNFAKGLAMVKDRMNQIGASAENFNKLSTLQTKASEAGAKLGVAQANAAQALKKAMDAAMGGTASAEQVAIAQAKAGLAAEKVNIAENNLGLAMGKVQAEGQRLAEAMQQDSEKTSVFSSIAEKIGNVLSSVKERFQGAAQSAGEMGTKVEGSSGGFKGILEGASKLGFAFMGVQMAVQTVSGAITSVLGPAEQYQAILDQTNKVLASTKGAAGESAKAITDLATSLSHTTVFSRDAVQSGENLLLTFTGIGKDVFPLATKTMLDMSKAMGQDVKSTAIQMGKALNDPAHGLTALTRVGVTFTAQQKEQIKAMVAAGNTAGAQKIMLQELQREFGKSADGTTTLAGKWQILKDRFSEIKENIGMAVTPVLGKLADIAINNLAPALDGVGNAVSKVARYFSLFDLSGISYAWKQLTTAVGDAIKPLNGAGGAFKSISPFLETLRNDFSQLLVSGIKDVAGVISNIAQAIQGLSKGGGGSGLSSLGNAFKQLQGPLQDIGNALKGELGKELKDLGQDAQQVGQWFANSVVPALKQAAPGFENLASAALKLSPVFIQIRGVVIDVLQNAFQKFAPIIEKIVPPLIQFAGIVANNLGNAIKFITPYILQAATAIGGFANEIIDRLQPIILGAIKAIEPAISEFSRVWGLVWGGISQFLKGVWEGIVGIIKIAWAIVTGIIKIGLDLISGNWGQAWTDMKTMVGGIWGGIKDMLHGFIDIISGLFDSVWSLLSGKVSAPFENAWNDISVVFDKIKGAIDWVTGQGNKVSSGANATLTGIHHFQSGVENFGGGLAYVHANEMLVNLPKGASVWNQAKTAQFMQNITMPAPAFAQSSAASTTQGSDQQTQLLTQIATYLAQMVQLQQQRQNSITMNANVSSGSMDAQKINQLVQSLGGFGYESDARGVG